MIGKPFNLIGQDGNRHEYKIIRQDKDRRYKIEIDGIPERRLVPEGFVKSWIKMATVAIRKAG